MEVTQLIDVSVGLAAVVLILKVVFDFVVKLREKRDLHGHTPSETLADISEKLTELLGKLKVLETKLEAAADHGVVVDSKLDALDERTRNLEVKVAALEARND